MDEPFFLTLNEVLQLHTYQIEQFGGDGEVLNLGLLESAIAQPQQGFGGEFLHNDLASMAAAYLFHIVMNHPFADGNKRTGMHTALVFLELNGYELDVPVETAEQLTLRVARGEAKKPEIAAFFRSLIAP